MAANFGIKYSRPAKQRFADGLWRLGCGGVLASLPAHSRTTRLRITSIGASGHSGPKMHVLAISSSVAWIIRRLYSSCAFDSTDATSRVPAHTPEAPKTQGRCHTAAIGDSAGTRSSMNTRRWASVRSRGRWRFARQQSGFRAQIGISDRCGCVLRFKRCYYNENSKRPMSGRLLIRGRYDATVAGILAALSGSFPRHLGAFLGDCFLPSVAFKTAVFRLGMR